MWWLRDVSEVNLAWKSEAFAAGKDPGYAPTALDGLTQSLDMIHQKKIKVVINGGALNPRGLAEVVRDMVSFDHHVCVNRHDVSLLGETSSALKRASIYLLLLWTGTT